jgi:ribonuclease HI
MAKKRKFYVVWKGTDPGIVDSWEKCLKRVKGYPDAQYKSFNSLEEAQDAFQNGYANSIERKKTAVKTVKIPEGLTHFICVDAACSGNPGIMEYRGIEFPSKQEIFHQKFDTGTNNIGEFLAIVHALAYCKKNNSSQPIYSDSKIAILWVNKKKCNTKIEGEKSIPLKEVIKRAENWLRNNTYNNPILKWETKLWGEIPADFGRK